MSSQSKIGCHFPLFYSCLIKRFFYSETSLGNHLKYFYSFLGEKITLLGVLERAARELADNPEKYNPEQYNEYSESKDFYFKPTAVKYCTINK